MKPIKGEGFVLAGGRSARMGRDKALLSWKGQSLLERAIDKLKSLGVPVTAVLNAEQDFAALEIPIVRDESPGKGPLGGLHTALRHSKQRLILLLACDLPLLPASLFSTLMKYSDLADVVVPADSRGFPQPLAAIYARECLQRIEARLAEKDLSLQGLLADPQLRVRLVAQDEHGVADHSFFNVNSPDDLRRLNETG